MSVEHLRLNAEVAEGLLKGLVDTINSSALDRRLQTELLEVILDLLFESDCFALEFVHALVDVDFGAVVGPGAVVKYAGGKHPEAAQNFWLNNG